MRPSWDDYFLSIAQAVAIRADCSRSQVGAVVVKKNRICSTGYNGAPAGEPGCASDGMCPRAFSDVAPLSGYDAGAGSCIAVHAESNALLYADRDKTEGAVVYITRAPCSGCRKLLQAAGVVRVLWPEGSWIPGYTE